MAEWQSDKVAEKQSFFVGDFCRSRHQPRHLLRVPPPSFAASAIGQSAGLLALAITRATDRSAKLLIPHPSPSVDHDVCRTKCSEIHLSFSKPLQKEKRA